MAPRIDRLISLGLEMRDAIREDTGGSRQDCFDFDAADVSKLCGTRSLRDDAPGWSGDWGRVLRHWGKLAEKYRANLRPFYGRFSNELLEALEEEEKKMDEILRIERFVSAADLPDMRKLDDSMFRWLTSLHMLYELRKESIAPDRELPRSAVEPGVVKVPMDDMVSQLEALKR